jgi:hypothetical protein
VFSNLGEIERFLMLYMVRDVAAIEKDGKGWDFGNTHLDSPRGCPYVGLIRG